MSNQPKNEMRQLVITVGLYALGAVLLAILIAALAGCQFHLLPNGLWGQGPREQAMPPVPGVTIEPDGTESPSGAGNGLPGDSGASDWSWLSDPALWGSVAVGFVYVANQVRKSKKYRRSN